MEQLKQFFTEELGKRGIALSKSWRFIQGLATYVNYFTLNSVEYHVFFSNNFFNDSEFLFGVSNRETMIPVISTTTLSFHSDYKTVIQNLLNTLAES